MMLKNEKFLLPLILLVSVSAMADNNDLSPMEREGAEKKMSLMKAIVQKRDVAITFYGKVVDQNNAPVVGANAEIHIQHFSPKESEFFGQIKTITVQTDNTGVFSVEKETGSSLYIQGISKAGHDGALLTDQNRSFQYFEEPGHPKPFVAGKKSPVVFRMRKQGDTTFLMNTVDWSCQVSANESGQTKGYDLIRATPVRDIAQLVLNDEPLVCDFKMKAVFNTNDTTWAVVLSPGNTNGGIIVSEQLLYEAPDTGYQPEYVFTPQDQKPLKTKYVYLRSRDPAIYSRLEVEYCTVAKRFIRLRGRSVTNPYGDRNFEQAGDLPYEATKQLADEAKASFRQNKRPSKPDLPKLVKEAKDKAEKDKPKQ
ncbi:MAG: hypothetical protein QME66_13205 [Candidatus Eisenbacteria bacterium]|nr:hypothetical protein [Candidatus Eisenbacteria bacterium]